MTETQQQETLPDYTLRQKLAAYLLMILLPAILAYCSVVLAKDVLAFTDQLLLRISLFALSGLSMFFALWMIVSPLRRKFKTGRFLLTRAESAARLAEHRSKMGAGKPVGPQAKYWILPLNLGMVFLCLGILVIVLAFSNCSCSGQPSWRPAFLLLLLAAAILIIPALFLFKSIQRKLKTGSILPSQEELDKTRAGCGKPKLLWHRITLAALWCFVALMWTDSAIGRQHHQGPAWLAAALSWLAALIYTYQVFRPPSPPCALPKAPQEPQSPPDAPLG